MVGVASIIKTCCWFTRSFFIALSPFFESPFQGHLRWLSCYTSTFEKSFHRSLPLGQIKRGAITLWCLVNIIAPRNLDAIVDNSYRPTGSCCFGEEINFYRNQWERCQFDLEPRIRTTLGFSWSALYSTPHRRFKSSTTVTMGFRHYIIVAARCLRAASISFVRWYTVAKRLAEDR